MIEKRLSLFLMMDTGLIFAVVRLFWKLMELKDDLIMEYAENESNPTKTVYGWVPIEVAERLVEKHGGIIDSPLSL